MKRMIRRTVAKLSVAVASVTALTFGSAMPAAAVGDTWDADVVALYGEGCVTGYSKYVSDDNRVDLSIARVNHYWDQGCTAYEALPPGWLAAKAAKWVWRPELVAWAVCAEGGWSFSTELTGEHATGLRTAYADCGYERWYGTMAAAYAWCGCEGWKGGGVWSGSLYAIPKVSAQRPNEGTAPPKPPWVRGDNTIDMSQLPQQAPVVGPDGAQKRGVDGQPVNVNVREMLTPPGKPAHS